MSSTVSGCKSVGHAREWFQTGHSETVVANNNHGTGAEGPTLERWRGYVYVGEMRSVCCHDVSEPARDGTKPYGHDDGLVPTAWGALPRDWVMSCALEFGGMENTWLDAGGSKRSSPGVSRGDRVRVVLERLGPSASICC
ncbi:hypothetical protein IF2G_05812 [Cordyceps javanica]|nr:hypothetical protein IF2G_05812 [Cordyceps javanica]